MEPYEMVGKFPSFNDFNEQNQRIKANQLSMMMQGNQVDNLPLQNQMLQYQVSGAGLANMQAQRKAQIMQMFADRLGGQGAPQGAPGVPSAALGSGAAQGSVGPTVANGNRLAAMQGGQQAGGLLGIDPDTMFLGEMAGMMPEGAAKLWTENRFGRPMQPGYRQNMDGTATYFGDPNKGVTMDAQGKVVEMPNAGATLAGMAGRTKAAETAGVASQTMAPETRLGADGRPVNQTVGQLLAGTGAPDPFNSSAPMGAPAGAATAPTPTALDQLNPAQQTAAAADMAQRGQDLSTMKVNGAPAFGDMQSQLDAAKQGGPTAIQRFVQSVAPSLKGDPKLMAGLAYDLHTPVGTPIHAMGAASGASAAPSAAPSASPFMGPAEAEALKITKANVANLASKPALDQATAMATDTGKATVDYQKELNTGVDSMFALMQRNEALKPLLAKFQTGGLLADQRNALSNTISNMGILPDAMKAKLADWVGSGDPAIGKTIAYSLAGEGIQNMLQTLGTSGDKPNRAEFVQMNKTKLGLDSGNLPIGLAMQQQEQAYRSLLSEQQSLNAAKKAGTFNADTWRGDYAAQRDKALFSSGTAPSGAPIAAQPITSATPTPPTSGFDSAAIAAELKRRGH